MKKLFGIVMLGILAFLVSDVQARSRSVSAKSTKSFYSLIRRRENPYSVAVFYEEGRKPRREDMGSNARAFLAMVNSVADYWPFREGDLQFIKVNVMRSDMDALMYQYAIDELPTCVLFKNGMPVRARAKQQPKGSSNVQQDGGIAKLTGFVTGDQLKDFIDSYLSKDLKVRADAKEEMRIRRAESAALYWSSYPYYWGGPYYPYYPYGRWGVGFGFGYGPRGYWW